MGRIWLHETPKYLHKFGVKYNLYPGWETRSRSSGGYESVMAIGIHHTASSATATPQSEMNWMWNSAPDRPIGNFLVDRTGTVHLGAAGAANTQGRGGPIRTSKGIISKDRGNLYFISIEASNSGRGQEWPHAQMEAYVKLCAALCDQFGLNPRTDIISHWEWVLPSQPNRKVDPTGPTPSMPEIGGLSGNNRWNDDAFRARVVKELEAIQPAPEPEQPYKPQSSEVPRTIRKAKMYTTVTPTRVYDTRPRRPRAGSTITVKTNLPEGATAAHVNLTVVDSVGSGFFSAWGTGNRPDTSVLNTSDRGQTIANAFTIPLNKSREFQVYTSAGDNFLVDVMGYHSA